MQPLYSVLQMPSEADKSNQAMWHESFLLMFFTADGHKKGQLHALQTSLGKTGWHL